MKFLSLAFLSLCVYANGLLANAADLKIAVVNYAVIEKNARVTQDFSRQVKTKENDLEKDVMKAQESAEKDVKALQEKSKVLSTSDFEKKQIELQNKLMKIKGDFETRALNLKDAQTRTVSTINDKISAIVANIAKSDDCDLIIPANSILYAKSHFDITDSVVKQLDSDLPTINVDWTPKQTQDTSAKKGKKK